MSDAERAWVGAIIDGEGTVTTESRVAVSFANISVELVATMLRIVGAGSICGQSKMRKPQHHRVWTWQLQRTYEAINLLAQVSGCSIKAQGALGILNVKGMVPTL